MRTANIQALKVMGARFQHLSVHDSLILLRHSFSIPQLQYLLRTAPCFLSERLEAYDDTLQPVVSSVTNTLLHKEDHAWLQATLLVKLGGLGVLSAMQVAPSAFLASIPRPLLS